MLLICYSRAESTSVNRICALLNLAPDPQNRQAASGGGNETEISAPKSDAWIAYSEPANPNRYFAIRILPGLREKPLKAGAGAVAARLFGCQRRISGARLSRGRSRHCHWHREFQQLALPSLSLSLLRSIVRAHCDLNGCLDRSEGNKMFARLLTPHARRRRRGGGGD